MKNSHVRVAAIVVLFLFVSSSIAFSVYKLPKAEIGSVAGFFFEPEPAALAALYVANPADFVITTDQGAPGLDAGDTVTWDPGPGSAHPGAVTGLIFGSNAFGTIQSAINAAVNGDTINVADGTYSELVTVNKSVTLRGNQFGVDARTRPVMSESIVNGAVVGGARSTSFNVTSSNVDIDGFTIQENSSVTQFGAGILVSAGTSGSKVRNNIVQDNITGLFLANGGATPAVIERNLFRNNNRPGSTSGTAIYTDQFISGAAVSNVVIDNNTFSNNVNGGVFLGSTLAGSQSDITISNNQMDTNGNAVLVFNLLNSTIFRNTLAGSAGSQMVIGGGVNGLTVSENVIQNGMSRGIRVGDLGGGGANQNVRVNRNSITGNVGAGMDVAVGGHTGILDATSNWWGDNTGPTIATNPGGTGQTIIDPSGVVDFQPWLMYGDADPGTTGFQIPLTFTVPAQTGTFTATNNNYRRLANVIDALQPGQTVNLSGAFDWTEANAAAAWALGNDGAASTVDDYSLTVRPNLNGVTVTATSLGSARIQGPGDLAAVNLEGVFHFDGGDNQNWTISNLEIFDFDLAIGMFNGAGGADAFRGTGILNNLIRVPADLNATAAPADVNQNIGIHFSFGVNQTIQDNEIQFIGNGISAGANLASSVGMQSNVGGGAVYDGLLIDNNTLRVLNAQSADPERILGIWENAHGHTSDITVSNNDFINDAAGNNPATNRQIAFRVTSHSSATTVIAYTGNSGSGANLGFEWISSQNFAGNQPVAVSGNTLTNVQTGFLIQSSGRASFTGNNSVSGTSNPASVGLDIRPGSRVSVFGGSFTNGGIGIDVDGIPTVALIQGTNLNFNSTAGLRVRNSAQVDAGGGGYTGLGTSTGGNDFSTYSPGGAFAIQNLNPDGGFTGAFTASPPDMRAQNNIFASSSAAFIEQVVNHDVDVATQGFVDFSGAIGGNTAPVANDDNYSTNEDTPLSGSSVLANDTDADSDPLTAVLVTGPSNAQSFTLNANGTFSYTPNTNFNGTDSFTYKANDGFVDSNVATVSITVNPVNDLPTAVIAPGGSCAGNSGTMNLIVGDVETAPGALVLSGDSSNTALVPLANISFGGSGATRTVSITIVPQQLPQQSVVTVTVTDGNSSSSQITITVFAGTKKTETINGTNDADMIFGQNGEDIINAGGGNDLVCSENGGSTINGGDGDDTIDGGSGNDVIRGGAGRDILIGGQGNDHLEGGDDDDTLTGGQGADFFSGGGGNDTATDFTPSRGDTSDGT